MRTLDRYIFREVAVTCIAVTIVLLVILLSNQLARVLSQAAANDFPREVVFTLIGLTSAGYLTVVVPVGFFLAIMLGLGRLYHESEMAAIQPALRTYSSRRIRPPGLTTRPSSRSAGTC